MKDDPKGSEDQREHDRRFAVGIAWGEITRIVGTNILSTEGTRSPLFQPAVVQVLICLSDLLQKAKDDGVPVAVKEDIPDIKGVSDLTDLIRTCRNAACHVGTGLNSTDFGKVRFSIIVGKGNAVRHGNEVVVGSEYDDDIAVYFGAVRVYLIRNIARAMREVSAALRIEGAQ